MLGPVKSLNLRIENCEDVPNIQLLISSVKPDWPLDNLQYKLFNEGTSNVLFAVCLDTPLSPDNCVLIRIFGYQTELYIDRDKEAICLWVLNQINFASEVYAKFLNGICYGYLPGSTVNYDLLSDQLYYRMVAEKMAELHTLPIDEFAERHFNDVGFLFDTSPCVLDSTLKFISLISDGLLDKAIFNGSGDNDNPENDHNRFPSKEYLIEEVLFLRKLLANAKSPVRFCHNDLLFGNIVISPDNNKIHFIDFEYCGHNNVCYDIANHFCEYCEMVNHDPSKHPSREMQRDWVRTYLQAFKARSGESGDVSSEELEEWLDEIGNFTLVLRFDDLNYG
ncbi:unnamed protein product [Hymenolepis diminuta]|uniref:ethanolamine kinase n=2 Tax=Hymenolepis diminuta TaxID=6216 RepID=A0A0R3SFE9_HYMDI|nr:unnamed protein product [Hymenolepis diminuta]